LDIWLEFNLTVEILIKIGRNLIWRLKILIKILTKINEISEKKLVFNLILARIKFGGDVFF